LAVKKIIYFTILYIIYYKNADIEHTLSNLNKDFEISQYVFSIGFHSQKGIDKFMRKSGNNYKITTYE